ncbi:thioredoxin family protein [Patescibacteria group bacterium]|nr:thioredoxin family protein [Patescibacteria group bacterium]
MVLTNSQMMALGTKALEFSLPDVASGKKVSLDDFSGKKAFLVMFICRHCPYVKNVQAEIRKLTLDYKDKDLGVVAISSNDIQNYPDDAPESLKEQAQEVGFNFPYCYDEAQEVAKAYTAACTPDFFLFDKERTLVYRGQLDDSRPGNDISPNGKDLRGAIDAVLAGKKVNSDQKPSTGCNIKWKPGNEPNYFN